MFGKKKKKTKEQKYVYVEPTDEDAKLRPTCEFSDSPDFPEGDTKTRTLLAVLDPEIPDRKFVCAYSWRSPDNYAYCRMKVPAFEGTDLKLDAVCISNKQTYVVAMSEEKQKVLISSMLNTVNSDYVLAGSQVGRYPQGKYRMKVRYTDGSATKFLCAVAKQARINPAHLVFAECVIGISSVTLVTQAG